MKSKKPKVKKQKMTTEKQKAVSTEKKGRSKTKQETMSSDKKQGKHKDSLERLKEQDPEFYKFLESEDQNLLNFSDSDAEDALSLYSGSDINDSKAPKPGKSRGKVEVAEDDLSGTDSDDEDDGIHKPPEKLAVASDSEDDEDYDDAGDSDEEEMESSSKVKNREVRDNRTPVTMKMVNKWTESLQSVSTPALVEVIQAFRAAVQCAGSEAVEKSRFKVKGSTVFNAVIRMCLKELPPMLDTLLRLPKKESKKVMLPSNSPHWRPIRKHLMSYLTDLIELLSQLSQADVLNAVLKHTSQMVSCYACFPKLGKSLLKRLIKLWSSGEETTRVLAFLSINRLVRLKGDLFLEFTVKQMYMAYVKNCKFTSPSTLPLINFMQRSLVEIFAVDQELVYQYAFMYIRQLAIHLRNAITVKKKDNCQLVYNWQYIHSIQLWARTLSQLYPSNTLEPLIYPLVQTVIGTIKLIPIARYYPLRFQCVQALNMLTTSTNTFIPVLPFLVEVFDLTDFNRRPKSSSMKAFNFACILKMSKSQLQEKSFVDGVVDQLYEHLMEAYHAHAHTVGFPELVLPSLLQLKKFTKTCKVSNYTKQIRQIVDKVQETSKVITLRRKSATLSLTDTKAVRLWEEKSKQEGTPLGKFYSTWRKLRDRELQFQVADKTRISSDDLPVIERQKGPKKATVKEPVDFSKIFDSGSDDSDDESRFLLKEDRPKKKLKTEEYSEFSEKELAKLAESGSEDDDDEDDDSVEVETDTDDEDEEEAMDSDIPDKEDIVQDFELSSDEE